MISIYLKKIAINSLYRKQSILLCVLFSVFLLMPISVFAQEGLSLSVTPTLFQMSASPLQSWNSGVKVINNNKQEITIYVNVVNFAPQGETGEGKFIPLFDEMKDGSTLAEWVTITNEPIVIPPEQSYTIPFSISVPETVSPGGHFAAILVGTKPPKTDGVVKVTTSQIVTSLLFVKIAGDVQEDGVVREFRTKKNFVDVPKADFEVRFENKGNVYLQPQGEIVITNMWGKERGIIPINHQTHFGNVLPQSIRKFEFSWSGEQSFSDIGRYKAVLALGYGEESKKSVTSVDYFYVIPVKAGLIVIGSLVALIAFVSWCIKAYVRRMLLIAGVDPMHEREIKHQKKSFVQDGDVRIEKRVSVRAPVEKGVLDLKHRLQNASAWLEKVYAFLRFIVSYKIFFASVGILLIATVAITLFIHQATKEQRDYEIVIDNADTNIKLSSEDILYEKSKETATQNSQQTVVRNENYRITLVNSSDTPGSASSLKTFLENIGYEIDALQSDFSKSKEKTVIVYDPLLQESALDLSRQIGNALLSANPVSSSTSQIVTIYIGNDYVPQ